MAIKIFYSWQSDRPNRACRSLIESALKGAIAELKKDIELDLALRNSPLEFDSDTQGVPGSPPIVETIFNKITDCAIFVADMTSVAERPDGGLSPNPNVLIEYGWAVAKKGYGRVICVMNDAFGKPTASNLPFDIRHIRWPKSYNLTEDASPDEKAIVKKNLRAILLSDIKSILASGLVDASPVEEKEPTLFQPKKALDGPSRFRSQNNALGVFDGRLPTSGRPILKSGPSMWLRIYPKMMQTRRWKSVELKPLVISGIAPLGTHDLQVQRSYFRSDDGYGSCVIIHEDNVADSVAIIFDTGELWAVDTFGLQTQADLVVEKRRWHAAISGYLKFIRLKLEIKGPLAWSAGFDGVIGRKLNLGAPPTAIYNLIGMGPRSAKDVIEAQGIINNDNVGEVLIPLLEEILDAFGEDPRSYPGLMSNSV